MRKLLFLLFSILFLWGCKKETEAPLPEIVLTPSVVEVEEGQRASVLLSGGDGNAYTVSPQTTDIAELSVEGTKINIVAKAPGMQVFTVLSGDRRATLTVKVKAKPTPEIILSPATVEVTAGETATVTISGGDGSNYSVNPATSTVADVLIAGNVLTVSAKTEGAQEFVIHSKDRSATLRVTVKPIPIPNLGNQIGVYDSNDKLLFMPRMTAKTKTGIWLMKSGVDPYSKRIFLSYVAKGVKVGETINYTIISEGLAPDVEDTDPDGRVLSVVVERIEENIIQLKSDKHRFVTNVR